MATATVCTSTALLMIYIFQVELSIISLSKLYYKYYYLCTHSYSPIQKKNRNFWQGYYYFEHNMTDGCGKEGLYTSQQLALSSLSIRLLKREDTFFPRGWHYSSLS